MPQVYFVSVVYLVLASCLLLVDKYGPSMLFLINLQSFYRSRKQYPVIFIILGVVVAASVVLFPMETGPMVLGDFIPAFTTLVVVFYFLKAYNSRTDAVVSFNDAKRNALGYVSLGVATLHFLFPSIVLI